jgi:antitoxin FitA
MPAEVVQAAVHGSSMEDEARDTLRSSLNQEPRGPKDLGTAINALFKPFGGLDLPEVPGEPMREPPTSDE